MLYLHHHQTNAINNVQPLGQQINMNDKNSASFCGTTKSSEMLITSKQNCHNALPTTKDHSYHD